MADKGYKDIHLTKEDIQAYLNDEKKRKEKIEKMTDEEFLQSISNTGL